MPKFAQEWGERPDSVATGDQGTGAERDLERSTIRTGKEKIMLAPQRIHQTQTLYRALSFFFFFFFIFLPN